MIARALLTASLFVLLACSPAEPPAPVAPPDAQSDVAAADVPAEVLAAAQAVVAGFVLKEAERKERDGRVYYDLEGARPDGAEVELDMLQEPGGWRVVEVQRDIAWGAAPASVRTAAAAAPGAFTPVRVIESTQTADGAVNFELFKEGRPEAPSMEVKVLRGKTEVMQTANPH